MLIKFWSGVVEGRPTINQHLVAVEVFPGEHTGTYLINPFSAGTHRLYMSESDSVDVGFRRVKTVPALKEKKYVSRHIGIKKKTSGLHGLYKNVF